MKRILGLVLVFCLVFSILAEAVAEPKWEISEQTKYVIKEKKGKASSVTISVKVKGKGIKYQWVFVDPNNPDRTSTGKKVAKEIEELKGLKVANPTKSKITLTNIPEALNGWKVYCHLYSNAYKMDTDPVVIVLPGMEPPPESDEPADAEGGDEDATEVPAEAETTKPAESEDKKTEDAEADTENESNEEGESYVAEPLEFTVTANGPYLYRIGSMGNPEGDVGVSSLTLTGSGDVAVKSEDPVKSWTINGIRYEPQDVVYGFKMFNLSSDTSVSLKAAAKVAASANVDESTYLRVSCTGCTFTYLPKGLKKVAEGEVPSGAVIFVVADGSEAASRGYSINGSEAQYPGASSIQVTVTEDTFIVIP